ncbi:MAG TPA: hypothetical protein VM096_19160, partial [Vicinamibacterales bacterium]|nr:hypothetical protein [Vicinamibacterales bacterium]
DQGSGIRDQGSGIRDQDVLIVREVHRRRLGRYRSVLVIADSAIADAGNDLAAEQRVGDDQ